MKTKNEVYVVVETQKKAKKLQKVLDMFGEKTYKGLPLELNLAIHFWNNDSWATCVENHYPKGKQKVSIKELRNILAVEHLKEGDVVIVDNNPNGGRYVLRITDNSTGQFYHDISYTFDTDFLDKTPARIIEGNFIRYATEEEKALLDPKEEKKELEVGKWYKAELNNYRGYLFAVFNGYNQRSYGIHPDNNGEWFDNHNWFSDFNMSDLKYTEATTEEVKQALAKEASKRGYERVTYDNGELFCRLPYSTVQRVYSNGVWKELDKNGDEPLKSKTEITDQDIATLERLHDTLADVHGYSLEFELMKSARVLAEKLRELKDSQITCRIIGDSLKFVLNSKPKLER